MRRQGSGFGFALMLLVLAVILFIALNNFKTVAPAALEIRKHNEARTAAEGVQPESVEPKSASTSTSASSDSWTPSPPSRPSLGTMDQNTSDHSKAVQDTLSQAN